MSACFTELRQSAEGVDVLPDLLGDGGEGVMEVVVTIVMLMTEDQLVGIMIVFIQGFKQTLKLTMSIIIMKTT